jgi:hypothetical protein
MCYKQAALTRIFPNGVVAVAALSFSFISSSSFSSFSSYFLLSLSYCSSDDVFHPPCTTFAKRITENCHR